MLMLDSKKDSEKTTEPRSPPSHCRSGMSWTVMEALEKKSRISQNENCKKLFVKQKKIKNASLTYRLYDITAIFISQRNNPEIKNRLFSFTNINEVLRT